jgi:hypothetical protein
MDKVEFHCHTSNSFDCRVELKNRLSAYYERGFTHLAITDHDRVLGAVDWQIIKSQANLIIIPAIEVSTHVGHVILLNCKFKPPINSLIFLAVWSKLFGCEIYIPHPCREGTGILVEYVKNKIPTQYIAWFLKKVKYIEVWNPRDRMGDKLIVDGEIFEILKSAMWTCASDSHFEDDIYNEGCKFAGLKEGDDRITRFFTQKIGVGDVNISFEFKPILRYIKSTIRYGFNYFR